MPIQTVQNSLEAKKTKFFSEKQLINSNLLAPFILQNFKKIVRANPELWAVPFSSLKRSIGPEQ